MNLTWTHVALSHHVYIITKLQKEKITASTNALFYFLMSVFENVLHRRKNNKAIYTII